MSLPAALPRLPRPIPSARRRALPGLRLAAPARPSGAGRARRSRMSIATRSSPPIEKRDDPSLARQACDHRRRKARRRVDRLLYRPDLRRALGDADVQGPEGLPRRRGIKPNIEKYAEVGREVRAADAGADAPRRAGLDRRGVSRPLRHRARCTMRAPPRPSRASPSASRRRSASRSRSDSSHNKFLAKIASDLDKPRGFSIIGRAETRGFLAEQPVAIIPGIGGAAQARLARAGITQIAPPARGDAGAAWSRRSAASGARSRALAHGEDSAPVRPEREAKSVSAETTFDARPRAPSRTLAPILWRLSERVSRRLKAPGSPGRHVTLKLKDAAVPAANAHALRAAADPARQPHLRSRRQLLERECDGTPFRLIGVGAADLATARRRIAATSPIGTSRARRTRRPRSTGSARSSAPAAMQRGLALARRLSADRALAGMHRRGRAEYRP